MESILLLFVFLFIDEKRKKKKKKKKKKENKKRKSQRAEARPQFTTGLFMWRWERRMGEVILLGGIINPPVHIISHINLITFTC